MCATSYLPVKCLNREEWGGGQHNETKRGEVVKMEVNEAIKSYTENEALTFYIRVTPFGVFK